MLHESRSPIDHQVEHGWFRHASKTPVRRTAIHKMAKGSLQVYLTGRKRYRSSVVRFHILYSPYRVTAAICYHSEFSSVGSMSASFEIPRGGESHLLRAEMPSCLVPTGCTLRSNKVFPGATGACLSVQLRLPLQEIDKPTAP